MNDLELITIHTYQAKQIEKTLNIVAVMLDSENSFTSIDKDVIKSLKMIRSVLNNSK